MPFNEKQKPEIVFVESPFVYTNGLITSSRVAFQEQRNEKQR